GRSGHGVRMRLRKAIPAGAGLGGGSADAAAAFAAVRRMLEVDIGDEELSELGAALGSDVPFCLRGGAAWMRGRGERLEPVTLEGQLPLVVVLPPFRISTPDVYRAWDELGGPSSTRIVPTPAALAGLGLPDGLVNDLEPAAEHIEPRLRPFREGLEALAGGPALLAGSGSAYVVPVASSAQAAVVATQAGVELRATAFATGLAARGVEAQRGIDQ
ncbi:MAG TPA: hypothetical protein VF954_01990, partial [Acidimicrobiales bacterium]